MPIKSKDEENLAALYAQNRNVFGGRKEDYFALQYIIKKFKVSVEEVAHQISFGSNDYGIDAFFIDRETRNLYIYQFKWTEDHNQFKDAMDRLAKDGIARVFMGQDQDPYHNEIISHLKRSLREHKNVIDNVYLHFVFKGNLDAIERSEGIDRRREDIENKSYLINKYFGDREVKFIIEFLSDRPGLSVGPPNQSYKVRLIGANQVVHGGRTMTLAFVRLIDLHGVYKGLGQRFFDRNIRGALSPDNAPNRKIREALTGMVIKGIEDPSVFVFRHNGVTLAAEKIILEKDHAILHTPRLLNGAQTISSLERFLEDNADNPNLKANLDKLGSITVVGKFIEDEPSSDFIANVTISNNQQNPVPPWALRAMDKRQVDLADKFRSELGIFYSRQEGAFEALTDEEKEELRIDDSRAIKIRNLASTFLAMQGDIHNMNHIPEVFESYKIYDETFKTKYLQLDAREIVLAYKVGMFLNHISQSMSESFPLKYQNAVSRAKNVAWALILQALKNHSNYNIYLEDYGRDLIKSVMFKELVKKVTKTRISILLKEIISSTDYKDKVDESKFDFLRASETFKRAMMIAKLRFGWTKQTY